MIRQRRDPTWPFLCILACLFVLSATWPRAWERVVRLRPGPAEGNLVTPVATHSVPDPAGRPGRVTRLDPAASLVGEPETGTDLGARQSSRLEQAIGRVSELQMVEPVERLVVRPIDLDWPELRLPDHILPARPAGPREEGGLSPLPATGLGTDEQPTERPRLVQPSPIDIQPPEDASPSDRHFSAIDVPSPDVCESPPSTDGDATEAHHGIWAEPAALFDRLENLAWQCDTGPWARKVARQVRRLGSAVSRGSQEEALSIVGRLNELDVSADSLAGQLGESSPAAELRRTQHALHRRLAVWSQVITAGWPFSTAGNPAEVDPGRLSSCLAEINSITGRSAAARAWRKYLALDALEQSVKEPATGEEDEQRMLARRVLRRFTQAGMTDRQRQFLASKPLAELRSELWRLAAEPVDLVGLLRHLEQYEQTGLPSDARLVAENCLLLEVSPVARHRELSRQLVTHYRNANVRLVVTKELLNRLMPDRKPVYQWVNDEVMGRPVRGRSVTRTDVGIRMIPDPSRLRLELQIKGLVSSLTATTSGPATFCNDSKSTYMALKEIEIGTWGLRLHPAKVSVDSSTRLRSLRTSLDLIPLVGALVKDIAYSQHEQSRPEMNREVEQKVYTRAKRQIDAEADSRLGELGDRLKHRMIEPLAELSLGPTMISAQTTDRRLTMRLRLADDEQLASHTPRPRAPSDSVASCQIHQSALNNAVQQMELDGGTFTPAELRRRIATQFNRPEMLEAEPGRDDVKITFADKDAVRVRCRDGRIALTLSIARLSKAPNRWKDFQIRVFYRPEINGRSVELVRDGVVQLMGQRLNTRAQIALRGIFSKTFSKHRPWLVTPERLSGDPRLANLEITQFEVDDGWIGLAVGPRRPGSQPVVAQRRIDDVD